MHSVHAFSKIIAVIFQLDRKIYTYFSKVAIIIIFFFLTASCQGPFYNHPEKVISFMIDIHENENIFSII